MGYFDYIEVVDLEIFAYHGVLKEEKRDGQTFYVTFKAYMDLEPSALADDLRLSVSYADMCQTTKNYVQGHCFDLIETVADGVAKNLLHQFPLLSKVEVWVKKPSAPIGEPVAYPQVYVTRSWHDVLIGIGSNLGEREVNISGAIATLNGPNGSVVDQSKVIETKPWGPIEQGPYLNTVIRYKTLLQPIGLMTYLLEVEQQFGRVRLEQWGARTLDLDVLFYDNLITDDPLIVVPHPYLHERMFVLESLMELCPDRVHPLLNRSVKDLYKALRREQL